MGSEKALLGSNGSRRDRLRGPTGGLSRSYTIRFGAGTFAVAIFLLLRLWPSCQNSHHERLSHIGDITWARTSEPGIEQGRIIVPLDYKNHSKGTTTLALKRLRSQSSHRKGTIFLNTGGPGGDSSEWSTAGLKGLALARVGPDYDIVGFSPRGIGRSTPRVECFTSPEAKAAFSTNTALQNGPELHPAIGSLAARENLIRYFKEVISLRETLGALCAKNMDPEVLKYMGTTYVAKDIDFMTTVIDGEDALINYWGLSYGSILGAYLVNMFPNRLGRVSVEGIADAAQWASVPSALWYPPWLVAADDAYNRLLDACVEAGQAACPLVKYENDTASVVSSRIDAFLDELYYHPLPVVGDKQSGILTSGAVRALVELALEVPHQWPAFTRSLADAMAGNATSLFRLVSIFGRPEMERTAVTCADNVPYSRHDHSDWPTAEGLADNALNALKTYSRRWGTASLVTEPDGGCEFWPTNKLEDIEGGTAAERFAGPWNHTLNNPILILNSIADPITPLTSAEVLHERLKNSSALVKQNSAGHTTVLALSLCTARHSLRYFNDGILPPANTTCEVDATPFGNSTADRHPKTPEERAILDGTLDIIGWVMGSVFK